MYVLRTKRCMYLVDRNPDLIDSQSLGKFGKCTEYLFWVPDVPPNNRGARSGRTRIVAKEGQAAP